jgi:hypothetical protein
MDDQGCKDIGKVKSGFSTQRRKLASVRNLGRFSPSSPFEIGIAISGEEGRLCPPQAGIGGLYLV